MTAGVVGAGEIYTGGAISLELDDAALADLLASFSEMAGIYIAVDPGAAAQGLLEQQVDAIYEDVPWDRALDEILTGAGLAWTLENQILWIHEPGVVLDGDRNFHGEPINLRLQDADIHDVMGSFSRITPFTIEVDPAIEAVVTVRVNQVPWDQVFDLILRLNGLSYSNQGDTLTVYRVTEATGRQVF